MIPQNEIKIQLRQFCDKKRILLVGNAKSIFDKKCGQEIDAFDIVIRFNFGWPDKPQFEYIGSKTDIWAQTLDGPRYRTIESKFRDVKFNLSLLGHLRFVEFYPTGDNVVTEDLVYYNELRQRSKIPYPSTGVTVTDFLTIKMGCSDVSCIGFDFFNTHTWYSVGEEVKRSLAHNGKLEKNYVLNQLKVKML